MEAFRGELEEFAAHCRKTHIDLQSVYAACTRDTRKTTKKWLLATILIILTAVALTSAYRQAFISHATAIGRIAMIHALPVYDWRPLKHETCLVANPLRKPHLTSKRSYSKCDFCRDAHNLPTLDATDPAVDEAMKSYWRIHAPIRICQTSASLRFDEEVMRMDEEYLRWDVCNELSNLPLPNGDYINVDEILRLIEGAPRFHVHWRNCHPRAMKLFRKYYPRPEFLHADFAPTRDSWVILAGGYENVTRQEYKKVPLGESVAIFTVLTGGINVRLTPGTCNCPNLTVDLHENESLVISDRWEAEYKFLQLAATTRPGEHRAIILEAAK